MTVSSLDVLLSRLDGVRQTGPDRWTARSPTRRDRTPSLAIRALDDGRILIHDFGGDDTVSILGAVGMTMADLMPARVSTHAPPERRPFPAADILRAIAMDAMVVLAAGSALLAGEPLSVVDRDRLSVAVGRIMSALDAGGLSHV